MMIHIQNLQCVLCGAIYNPAEVIYTCPACGPLGVLEVHYDYEQVARHISRAALEAERDITMWRYRALLPISYSHKIMPPLAIGGTPLYAVERLRAILGMRDLWLKDDSRNPSASLKDRASIIAVMRAEGRTVACASTGSASGSARFAVLYLRAAQCSARQDRAIANVRGDGLCSAGQL